MIIWYRRFGTTYRSHLQGQSSPRTIDPRRRIRVVYPETSVWSYYSIL